MPGLRVTTTSGAETTLPETAIDELRSGLRGALLRSGDEGYDTARQVFNSMIDRRPAAISSCAGAADVVRSVQFARTHDLVVAVRGGGHSVAGKSVCDGGVLIDLSRMKGIRVDPERRTVRAQPGLRLGEFDRETQAFGLATPLGIISNTGIAGLTLGGGIGWLNGKHGLACDNLLSVDVVTAEGRLLVASAAHNADLFWGVRGGSGNFGIVTSFEYQLHPVGPVLGGAVFYPFDSARQVLSSFLELCDGCPDELSPMAALLTLPDGTPAVAVAICYCGDPSDGEAVVKPFRSLGTPIADAIQPMPYVALQSMLDASFPPGQQHYWKSSFTRGLDHDGFRTLVDALSRKPSPGTIAYLELVHGAAGRMEPTANAFPHRGKRYDFAILSQWPDPAESEQNIAWTRDAFEAIRPHLDEGVYVNNLGDEGDERVRAAYGPNYGRLAALKRKYDPQNFFRLNQNIRPG